MEKRRYHFIEIEKRFHDELSPLHQVYCKLHASWRLWMSSTTRYCSTPLSKVRDLAEYRFQI